MYIQGDLDYLVSYEIYSQTGIKISYLFQGVISNTPLATKDVWFWVDTQ